MIRAAVTCAVLAVVLCAGCGDDGGEDAATTPDTATTTGTGTTTVELVGPAETLSDFIQVAARGNAAATWALLSPATKRRHGPALAAFRRSKARELERQLRAFRRRFDVQVAGRITEHFGFGAATAGTEAFATALRLDGQEWSVELGGPIRIEAVRPEPGERVTRRTQVAAEVKAGAAIEDAGLWLDGRALPARGGGLTNRALTMFADTGTLETGRHSAVAFAATASHATAYAWAFTARGGSGGDDETPPVGPA